MGNRKIIDMIGYEFQNWKVIDSSERRSSGNNAYWLCECQVCGRQKEFCGSEIRKGRTGECNHKISKPKIKTETANYIKVTGSASNKIKDETGKVYGKLKVLSFANIRNSNAYWNCRCECGNEIIARGNALRFGEVQSCGCTRSWKEEEIKEILLNHNIVFQREYSFNDLKDKNYLRFDFAIFNENNMLLGLIEYQGQQHYESECWFNHFGLLQKHDLMKQQYCKQNGISLLELNKESNLEKDILNWYFNLLKSK